MASYLWDRAGGGTALPLRGSPQSNSFLPLSLCDVSSFAPVICQPGGAALRGLFQAEEEIRESYSYMAGPDCDLPASYHYSPFRSSLPFFFPSIKYSNFPSTAARLFLPASASVARRRRRLVVFARSYMMHLPLLSPHWLKTPDLLLFSFSPLILLSLG